MPELRRDPITGRWVIIASERAKRPKDFLTEKTVHGGALCPFCPGHEGLTPPEILAARAAGAAPNSPGWSVRVVPNRYPALRIEGPLERRGEGMYDRMTGVGAHEVIIETPEHDADLADLETGQVAAVLRAYRERSLDLRKDRRFRYVLIFRNHGESAGATLEHPHSQLIATPVVPKRVQEEIAGAHQYRGLKERCVFCDIVQQELEDRKRLVLENDGVVAFAPFAARFPFETWILPRAHAHDFGSAPDAELDHAAAALRETLKRLKQVLDDAPYNMVLHTSPLEGPGGQDAGAGDAMHWHLEIMPRLTKVAGFEYGSGFFINPTPPEEAAEFLRNA